MTTLLPSTLKLRETQVYLFEIMFDRLEAGIAHL